jgi:hypothetical protein
MAHEVVSDLEMPLPSVLDATETDPLLQKLRAVHGEPRYDIARELIATTRRARFEKTASQPHA